ncbi:MULTISPECIES: cytochrome P450 [unclassified Rhodococcus (in: high G+C Gram-positive bacteria)]|uniref:cytochrome P450 n=1 Tax=unclassified Rhodococcus (in: high G+C Gram-positive bacteria) TaxID=192944 RepID=UPI0007C7DEE9|nr:MULTISPECIES: cytochrome P450 [unclassified Rhodococcus (in: high G+C Gram-positive bacteria)]
MGTVPEAITTAAGQDLPANVPAERVVDFDMFNPPHIDQGLQEAWKHLQESSGHDLMWTHHNGGHWIATRGSLVKHILTDYEHFSSKCPFLPREAGEQYVLIPMSMDPPEQRPYRRILNASIGPRIVDGIGDEIRSSARELVRQIRPAGSCDFIKEYAEVFPVKVFLTMIDLPPSDAPRLKYIADQMTRPDGSMTMAEATNQFFEYLSPFIDARTAEPGNDAISIVVQSKVDGRPITKDEALKICSLLVLAGLDTVVNFLGFMMHFLAENPEKRRALVKDPQLIPTAIEELLRRFALVTDARLIKKDVKLDGVDLKPGDMVAVPSMLYGLEEQNNQCPMDVDFGREKIEHMTFGHGVHHCAGAHLARVEVQVTLEEWLAHIPEFEVADPSRVGYQSGIVGSVTSVPLRWTTD